MKMYSVPVMLPTSRSLVTEGVLRDTTVIHHYFSVLCKLELGQGFMQHSHHSDLMRLKILASMIDQ